MGTIQKRACDGCHRRKVKCDSNSPCRNCGTANIQCTYNAIPQKKGPKGSRAKVISELRENQRMTSLPVKVQARINGVQSEPITHHNPTPGLLTHDIAKSCLNFFFEHVYTKLPILHRETIESQMPSLERNPDTYCLFTSLCAFMMLQPGMTFPMADYNMEMPYGANIAASTILIEECIRVRKGQDVKGFEHWEKPSLNVLATNFFIFAYHYVQENHSSAWYYLREGTTIIQMSGMGNEENYQQDFDSIRRRRLFWLFHNAERAYALQRNYPITLGPSLHVGQNGDCTTDDCFNPSINNNFFNLCDVYRHVDDAFLNAWRLGCRNIDAQTITSLNASLREVLPQHQQYPPSNYSGVQNWLRKMLWEVTDRQESGLRLSQLLSNFPSTEYQMLVNSGLIPKLLQVTLDLIPYLTNAPASRSPTSAGPEQYLQILCRICMAIGSDHFQFVPLLLSKVQEILPRIIDPKLLNAPIEAVDYNRMPADIFDGFGNAGMAPMHMNDYNGMPMEQYDNKYEDMSGNSPDSLPHSHHSHHSHHSNSPPNSQLGNDMPQNFVSSPGTVMSPGAGMDYNPNIGAFNMTDIVMNPMGGPAPPNAMHMQQQQQQQLNNPSQMQGIPNQTINAPSLNQGIGSLYGGVRQPSRQSSFNMPGQTPLSAMGSMPGGLDFNTLPR